MAFRSTLLALLPAGLAGCLAATALGCQGRAPRAERGSDSSESASAKTGKGTALDGPAIVEIDLSSGVPEGRSSGLLGASTRRSHVDLVGTLRSLADPESASSSQTKGLLVRFGARIGFARAEEIGALLGKIRETKPVVCHSDEYGNATMMLAALGCSKIYVSPAGGVETVGIAAQLLFANRLLERLHVGVDFLQVGKYKGAQEPYTRNEPSPEARSSLEGTLRGMRAAWIAHVVEGRKKLSVGDAVEDGPWTPDDAVAHGLIDATGYLDDAKDEIEKLAGVDRVVPRFGGGPGGHGLLGILRSLGGSTRGSSPHVAVIEASGAITMSASSSLLGGNEGINERDLGRIVTRLSGDSSVKAVVLRIDSPGGSALASDLLWKRLRKLAAKKPLVVSVGDMAASGGYYLSCAGTKILAEPTSIVGSIGVVGGKLAFGKTLEEIGVHAETVAAAPDPAKAARATYNSTFSAWDDATRAKVLASMKAIYDLFLRRVAEGRGSTVEAVGSFAEGRIFSGLEAKERGLVDQIGGVGDAIDLARQLASLPKDTPFEVVEEETGLLGYLEEGERSGGGDDESSARSLADATRKAARDIAFPPGWDARLPGAAAFLGSMSPLLDGDGALAAMPYGITLR